MNSQLTRRGLFSLLTGRSKRPERASATAVADRVAIIQGRHCIALTSFCGVCVERCPVPGAMTTANGMPFVSADACTGCGLCQDVCPAPKNAVLMLPRRHKPNTLQPA